MKKYQPQRYIKPHHPVVAVLELIISIVYIFALLFVSLHPDFEILTTKPWFVILALAVTVGVHLFYVIAEKDRGHKGFTATMLLAIPTYLLYLFCEANRLYIAIFTLLLPIYIYLFLAYEINKKDSKEHCDVVIALTLMFVFLQTSNAWFTTYANEGTETKYILIALVGAIVGVIICIMLLKRGALKFESVSSNYLALFFAFLISATITFSFISSFNYCLDTSTPEIIEAEITNKEEVGSGRSVSHHIYVDVNGETIEFRTGIKRFSQAEPGEKVKVYLYDGFLGDGYYILDLNQ